MGAVSLIWGCIRSRLCWGREEEGGEGEGEREGEGGKKKKSSINKCIIHQTALTSWLVCRNLKINRHRSLNRLNKMNHCQQSIKTVPIKDQRHSETGGNSPSVTQNWEQIWEAQPRWHLCEYGLLNSLETGL